MNEIKKNRAATYTKGELTGFLVGLAGQNIIYNIIASGLSVYLKNVIFIPAMAVSVIFALARVWDAINDPIMGSIVDKTRSKWGKCKPYLMFIPPVVCVITILCFVNGIYTEAASSFQRVLIVGWAGLAYILWGMIYTIGDIPLWGVTSLMTEDQDDRAKALALARICASFGFIGMLITFVAPSMPGMFTAKGVSDEKALQYSYILVAVVLTVFASVLFEVAGLTVHERVKQTKEPYTLKENFKIMFRCRPFRQLLISGILRSPIQLLSLVAMELILYYYFDNDPFAVLMTDEGLNVMMVVKILLLAVGVFGGMLISSGVTPNLARKIEKKKLYNFYSVIGAIPYVFVYIVYKVSGGDLTSMGMTVVLSLVFFFASWSMGGLNVLQSVMIADCVDYEEYHNGGRPDGVFFSGQSFITKLSAGIATLISGAVYSIVGYTDSNIAALNEALRAGQHFATYNDGKYAAAMFLLVSIPPAVGMVLSAIPTLKYAMTDAEHTQMLDELNKKRAAAEASGDNEG